jgi:uncharacterized protein YjiS (DUF1127 family)
MMTFARRTAMARRGRRALPPASGLRTAGVGLVLALLRWHELAQQRRRLLALDDRMLKDIGLTRADACREGARPFWDARGIDWGQWP